MLSMQAVATAPNQHSQSGIAIFLAVPASNHPGPEAKASLAMSADNPGIQQKDRLTAVSPKSSPIFLIDQTTDAAFRFLRRASRPNAPRPVAKSGKAAGSGVSPRELVSVSDQLIAFPGPPTWFAFKIAKAS